MKNLDEDAVELLMEMYEDELRIDATQKVPAPEPVLSLGTKTYETKDGLAEYPLALGTKGNFIFVQAPPKSKKTFFISLLSAVYMNGSLETFGGDLKGYREDNNLIHFDTEQSNFHCQMVFKRPLEMAKVDTSKYHTYALRQLDYKERIRFIEHVLYKKLEGKNIGLVIIDGIADLCSDANNIEESNAVVQKLMTWSKELHCNIITVIHSNFGSDKPTGHLGSFLEKKAETQIQLELNTVNKELVTVSCKRSRNASFETFSFKVNNFGLPQVEGAMYDPLKGVF